MNKNIAHQQILVVGPSWVGDMIMAQSLFKLIKNNSPQPRISVLAPKWSEPVLDRMAEVDESIEMPVGHGSLKLGIRRKLAQTLRHYRFSQAIILPGSFKSALIPWLADIPKRTGFVGEQRWGLVNDIRKLDKFRLPLSVQRYVSLGLDKSEDLPKIPNPELQVDQQQLDKTLKLFGLKVEKPVLVLCPGAEYGPAKQWPAKQYAEVAREKYRNGWQVWLMGSENDRNIAQLIADMSGGGCINLAGKTTLGEAVDLLSCAKYTVTNDSGLMHVAAAVGSHVVALYGSSSPGYTPPLTDKSDVIYLNLDCSPCFKKQCPLGHLDCLNNISAERVLSKLN